MKKKIPNSQGTFSPGTFLKDYHNAYWLVLKENEFRNIDNHSVVNLFDGSIRDINWLSSPEVVTHLEIMW